MSDEGYILKFLGSGSFFTMKNFHSNIILRDNKSGKCLLIDCGTDIRWALQKANEDLSDIEAVYISHTHADHAGGLEWLGYAKYFNKDADKPSLVCHHSIVPKLVRQLDTMMALTNHTADLSTFFNIIRCEETFSWRGMDFQVIPQIHVPNEEGDLMSYGLVMSSQEGDTWYLTTDSVVNRNNLTDYKEIYQEVDLIFHDCETINTSEVHTHYDFLNRFPKQVKKKMWLYHYQDNPEQDPVADGFAGFVKRGDEFIYSF